MKAEDVDVALVRAARAAVLQAKAIHGPLGSHNEMRIALAAVLPEIQAQALNGITEVFEIVDRHTNRRLEERVYLTANEALSHVTTWPTPGQRIARVQSVARLTATDEETTT